MEDLENNDQKPSFIDTVEQIRRVFLSPTDNGFHHSCLFTRRYINEKKKNQFYLYSEDEDNLYAAAALSGPDIFYSISLNANSLNSDSVWSTGSLKGSKSALQFTGIAFHPESQDRFRNTIRISYIKLGKVLKVKLAPSDVEKFLFLDDSNDKSLSMDQVIIPHLPNYPDTAFRYGLILNQNLCFTFTQTHQDEFYVQIGHPLSLFQAFCICLATIPSFSL